LASEWVKVALVLGLARVVGQVLAMVPVQGLAAVLEVALAMAQARVLAKCRKTKIL